MRRSVFLLLLVGALGATASCSMLLDVDALQEGTGQGGATADAGEDSSAGTGGSGGAAGMGGGAGVGGAAGAGGTGVGGSAGGTGDAGPQEVTLDDLGAALAEATCANLQACAGPLAELAYHEDDCVAFYTAAMEDTIVGAIQRSVHEGAFTYDPVLGAECVKQLLDWASQTPPVCADLQKGLDECRAAIGGLGGAGAACTNYYECQSGYYCENDAACPGTCSAFLQQGQPCVKTEQCGIGMACVENLIGDGGKSGTCEPYTPTNGACGATKPPCVVGDYCVNNKCLRLANAFTTQTDYECYSTGVMCAPGLSCVFNGLPFLSKGTCTEPIVAGQPCSVGVPEACATGLYCTYGAGLNPKCLALPTENQACAGATVQLAGISPPCAAGLACVDGICLTRKRLDEACQGDTQCYSTLCSPAGAGACTLAACL